MKAVLTIVSMNQVFDVEVSVGNRLVLGRGSHTNPPIKDEKVSVKHCIFTINNGYLKLEDADSKNGTYLNGIRIDNAEIFIGDEIKIGDTIITLNEKSMDNYAVDNLTFPGPKKERMDYELKADFTGARIQNQLYTHAHPDNLLNTPSQAKEIALRKKAQTRIILSKQEIKLRSLSQVHSARWIDGILTFFVFLLPIIYVNSASRFGGIPWLELSAEIVNKHRMNLIGAGEIFFSGMFFIINSRLMNFSIGEKLMGVEKLYQDQNN